MFCFPFLGGSFVIDEVVEFGVWASVLVVGFIGLIVVFVLLPWLIVVC